MDVADSNVAAPVTGTNVWGIFAWMILAIDLLLAFGLASLPRNQPTVDLAAAAVFVIGTFVLVLLTMAGVGCGIASAAIAYRRADRRLLVALPAFAHVLLLMTFFGIVSWGAG